MCWIYSLISPWENLAFAHSAAAITTIFDFDQELNDANLALFVPPGNMEWGLPGNSTHDQQMELLI